MRTVPLSAGSGREAKRQLALGFVVLFAISIGGGPLEAQEAPLRSGPVVFRYPDGARRAALRFLEATPRALATVNSLTGATVPNPTLVEIVPDGDTLVRRCREEVGADVPAFVAGVSLGGRRHVIVRLDLPGPRWEQIDGLLAHELCHVALDGIRARPGAGRLPRWFDEGVAQLAEGRPFLDDVPLLGPRAWLGTLLDFERLEEGFPETEGASSLAYAQSESFVRYLQRTSRLRGGLPRILDEIGEGSDLDDAVRSATSFGLEIHRTLWREQLRSDRSWVWGSIREVAFGVFLVIVVVIGIRFRRRRRREWDRRWQEQEGAEEPAEALPADEDQASTNSSR